MKPTIEEQNSLIKLAESLTLQYPEINVLKSDREYPIITEAIEDHFQKLEESKKLLLPELRDGNESVMIFSDYGGEHSESKYRTYSFLICAWGKSGNFTSEMEKIRKKHNLKEKEISFKDFRYGPIQRSLDDYLAKLSHFLPGLLFTLIIDKEIGSVFGTDKREAQRNLAKVLEDNELGKWKPEVAEKLLIITHIVSYLIALLAKEGQKITWMTDNDSILEANKANHAVDLFGNILNYYSDKKYEFVACMTPPEKKEIKTLDMLSATDIVAGSIEHLFSKQSIDGKDVDLKDGTNKVLEWLVHDGIALKKQTIRIKKDSKTGKVVSSSVVFEAKDTDPEAVFIPVIIKK